MRSLLAHGLPRLVRDLVGRLLDLAAHLVDVAFALQILVARHLACGLLDATLCLVSGHEILLACCSPMESGLRRSATAETPMARPPIPPAPCTVAIPGGVRG